MWVFWSLLAILTYQYVGYLALLLAIRPFVRRKQLDGSPDPALPAVTLIIPAYNEERILREKLENSLAIDYPVENLEILVVSDGSIDNTIEIARSFSDRGIRLLSYEARRGKASVLNDAVRSTTSDVLCLCDANVLFRPDAIRLLVSCLSDHKVGAATGQVRLESHQSNFGHGEELYYWLERILQASESKVGCLMGVDGGMFVIRRELFEPLPSDTILDDFAISMAVIRRGYRIVYDSKAIATENGTPTGLEEYRRRVRIAAGAGQSLKRGNWPPLYRPVLLWQFLSHKLLRWLGALFLPILTLANAMLWSIGPFYEATFLAQLAVYAVAGLAALSVTLRKTPVGGIPFYFVMSHVAMAIGLIKGLFNLQSVRWSKAERINDLSKLEIIHSPSGRGSG